MSISNERSYISYLVGDLFDIRVEEGLFPHFHSKLEHCRVKEGGHQLSIQRGMPNPALTCIPQTKMIQVSDRFQSVVVAWRSKIGEELLVSDGRFEVVGEGGVYEISPGNLTVHGPPSEGFIDLLFLPLANQFLVPMGSLMVHGGAVEVDGKVVLLLGESGKTSLVLSLLEKGADYLGDECVILDKEGICHPYTPYIVVDDRHLEHFPELFERCYPDPAVRRRKRKRMSFYHMGYNLNEGNFVSRQMRELLTTRMFFEGESCRFDSLFPKAKMPSSGSISHVFRLRATNEDGPTVPMGHRQIAEMESTCTWIRTGHIPTMARLAGMPSIDLPMMQDAFATAIKGAECYQLRMKLRNSRSRDYLDRTADDILDKVNKGRGAGRG